MIRMPPGSSTCCGPCCATSAEANIPTVLLSIGTITLLLLIGKFAPLVPGPLVVVVLGIALAAFGGLPSMGVVLIPEVPQEFRCRPARRSTTSDNSSRRAGYRDGRSWKRSQSHAAFAGPRNLRSMPTASCPPTALPRLVSFVLPHIAAGRVGSPRPG